MSAGYRPIPKRGGRELDPELQSVPHKTNTFGMDVVQCMQLSLIWCICMMCCVVRDRTLYVGNLNRHVTEYHLMQLFSQFGELTRVQFMCQSNN